MVFVSFMDEYSRYIVHQEVLTGMDGISGSGRLVC